MKAISALALLAVVGLAAGCGSEKKAGPTTGPDKKAGAIAAPTITAPTITAPIRLPGEGAKTTSGSIVLGSRSIAFTRPATATISDVKTGTRVSCKAGPGAQAVGVSVLVPPRGQGVGGSADGSPSAEVQVTHLRNGSVTVSCRSSD